MFCKRIGVLLLIAFASSTVTAQIRFYAQYRGIPFYKGGTTDFSVLTGVKLDPNKEIVAGIGLSGRFSPRNFRNDLTFSKNTFSLGFNYYWSRRFYTGMDVSLNEIRTLVKQNSLSNETITGKIFLDYQLRLSYIVLRRLHFSVSGGVVDLTRIAVRTTNELVEEQDVVPDVALSLRIYVFQIRL